MVESQPYGNGRRDLWALFWPSKPCRNTTLIQWTPEAVPYPCDNDSKSPAICCIDIPPADCCVFYFDYKNIPHVNNINLNTFNTKARRISLWRNCQSVLPCQDVNHGLGITLVTHPSMIISGGMGHVYNVVLANKGARTPCCSTKLPTSDGRLTGYIIVSYSLPSDWRFQRWHW
jgi:hypothetical protein